MDVLSSPRLAIQAGRASPIVEQTSMRTAKVIAARKYFIWSSVNFICSLLLFYELNYGVIQCWLRVDNDLIYSFLMVVAIVFFLNALVDFIQGTNKSFAATSVALSPVQRKLMGVRMSDPGFNNMATASLQTLSSTNTSFQKFSLSNFTMQSSSSSLLKYSPASEQSFRSSSSFQAYTPGPPCFCDDSFYNKSTPLPPQFDGTNFLDSTGGSPHLRHRRTPLANSPLSPDDFMTDQKILNDYLKSYFERAQAKIQLYGYDSPSSGARGYWNPTSFNFHDGLSELARNLYQLSTRSPKPTRSTDNRDDSAKIAAMEYWIREGIDADCLTEWVARLRRWISLTILRGIVKEIDEINRTLKHLGSSEVQIGESSLQAIKQIQASKGSQIPTITWMLSYLELTSQQEYLVDRIRTLASGGYLSEFQWDKGGKIKGRREWGDDLVTDCELIMHLFSVYMDLHLPPNSRYPDGRTFSGQFFVKTPDKPKLKNTSETKMMIFQSSLHPPHYQLVTSDRTYDLPPGRHNMFCSLLLFLHHIKTKQSSMLGQVNLGLSGINILHVLEPFSRNNYDVILNASRPHGSE